MTAHHRLHLRRPGQRLFCKKNDFRINYCHNFNGLRETKTKAKNKNKMEYNFKDTRKNFFDDKNQYSKNAQRATALLRSCRTLDTIIRISN